MKMRHFLHLAFTFLLLLLFRFSNAQDASVITRIDSTSMLIGSQQTLRIGLHHPDRDDEMKILIQPLLDEQWEVIKQSHITHEKTDEGYLSYKDYVITYWEVGEQSIPPIKIIYKNGSEVDTFKTSLIHVNVISPAGKLTGIQGLKDIYRMPYPTGRILWIVAGIILCLVIIYLLYRNFKKDPEEEEIVEEIEVLPPPDPPYEIAMRRLNALTEKQLIERGEIDLFQSELTHIMRQFLGTTYAFDALEMTTEEILGFMEKEDIYTDSLGKLSRFLRMADLVKFAKAQPEGELHRSMMEFAYETVHQLKNDVRTGILMTDKMYQSEEE